MSPENKNMKKKRPELIIRNMEIEDLAFVYRLGEKLFTSEESPILYRTWDPYEVTEYFTSDAEYCLVAEANGAIVGFIIATTIEKAGTAWKRYGYVAWMGVDEAFQRRSLGRRMYKKLEEELLEDGVRMVIADTEGDNEEAISFFKAIGFSPRSEHIWLAKTLRKPVRGIPKGKRVRETLPEIVETLE